MTAAPKTGVMICGHGSRAASAVDEFAQLAEKLPALLPSDWLVEYGYLEFANPVIRDGLDRLRAAGCERILAVPGMLFAAMHAKNDIPTVLNSYAAEHGLSISYGRELGIDPKMLAAAAGRIRQAVAEADARYGAHPLAQTCLVVIGRGASDPDANGNVAKIARMLQEGMGFGWVETGFSGVTFPLVEPCLQHVARLPYKRVIVFPYFLFSGVLIDRIYGFTDQVAAEYPGITFVKAPYLGDHPEVLATFAERIVEQTSQTPPPNCGTCGYRTQILASEGRPVQRIAPEDRAGHPAHGAVPPPTCVLCKYRVAVLGFEAEVGAVQESHHHHVEGQGAAAPGSNVADCTLCDHFCTGLCRLSKQDLHAHQHAHGLEHDHTHDLDHDHAHDHHAHDHGQHHGQHHGHHHGHHNGHDHHHGHEDGHHHHDHAPPHAHPVYPHARHPHGPLSALKSRKP